MNKEEADYLYLDRFQGQIQHEMKNAMDGGTEEDLAMAILHAEEYQALKYGPQKPITAKSVLQDLYELTQAQDIRDADTGEEISLGDFQDMVYQDVETLADLLEIELED